MFSMRVLTPPELADSALSALLGLEGVSNVLVGGVTRDGGMQSITADVTGYSVDETFTRLDDLGIDPNAVTLLRESPVSAPAGRTGGWFTYTRSALVWAEALDVARDNAVLTARYIAYMVAAGTIAACGVILANPILIVGAMAVSPDLLPLSAFSIGVAGRRPRLAARGMGVLTVGLVVAGISAFVVAWALRAIGAYDGVLSSGNALSGIVVSVSPDTFIVAFAAGVAGMLAFETRASAAVGVAISVTTIPAVAFAGVAIGIGEYSRGENALVVLFVNVVVLFVAGVLTLVVQRKLGRRYQ
jgi:uncharacterized hydrophobic protein (TIGR00271 family)